METTNQQNQVNEEISKENLLRFLDLEFLDQFICNAMQLCLGLANGKRWVALPVIMALTFNSYGQETVKKKKTVTVLNIDAHAITGIDAVEMGNMVRLELEKLDTFEVMDRYDVSYVVEKNKLAIGNCYGKICLVEVGNTIHSDMMFTGSVELIGETIIVTLRLIDVAGDKIIKTQVNEYLNNQHEIQSMVKISIAKMFGLPVEEPLVTYLTKKNNFESSTNNPEKTSVNLSGPRSGFTWFTGKAGERIQESRNEGGFGSYPVMFQFGYQFEVQYLNEGNYQALFEFLPTITGFNQNIFIPSLTIMNGFRNNKHGWEIAFGPTFGLVTKANGYFDAASRWHLENDWTDSTEQNPFPIESRVDSRGSYELQAGFIVAAGKTFRSGKLNIPVNFYWIPSKDGMRFGASFGFNAKKH